jgi:hypothetical protein
MDNAFASYHLQALRCDRAILALRSGLREEWRPEAGVAHACPLHHVVRPSIWLGFTSLAKRKLPSGVLINTLLLSFNLSLRLGPRARTV